MHKTRAYAAQSKDSGFSPLEFERRDLRPDDVAIDIDYCGVCHTDIHFVENDWGRTKYPIVPGHEIIGTVRAVGSTVKNYRAGDRVGIGCMVDSCRECSSCEMGLEQYCAEGFVSTYNGEDRHDQSITYGGYSEHVVVSERFVVRVPEKLDPAAAAPILCAGITTFSPLRHFGIKAGDKVGVVGMGGLGHMAVKFANAMGAEVTLFTRSNSKVDEARSQGAHHVVISTEREQMKAARESLDFILNTVPVPHDLNPYVNCLKVDGTMCMVGLIEPLKDPLNIGGLIGRRRVLAGSLIGGMPETREVLDFCAEHDISCDIEMLDIRNIDDAYQRMKKGDVKYRFVIDIASLKDS